MLLVKLLSLILALQAGMVEALSLHKKWKGYTFDHEGSQKLVFTLKEPLSYPCVARNNAIKISTEPSGSCFEVKGYFPNRDCTIVDSTNNVIAQVYLLLYNPQQNDIKNHMNPSIKGFSFYYRLP